MWGLGSRFLGFRIAYGNGQLGPGCPSNNGISFVLKLFLFSIQEDMSCMFCFLFVFGFSFLFSFLCSLSWLYFPALLSVFLVILLRVQC